jgi:hypothetical protein
MVINNMRATFVLHSVLVVVLAVALASCGKSGGEMPTKPYSTCIALLNLAASGCEAYKNGHGAWPNSLEDVYSMADDITRKDAWGHDFAFTPYDAAKGYGEVISYGRDGKPGGSGEDADLVIRFPVKANADWNRQQAMSVKVPKEIAGNSAWYEFYLR